MIFVKDQAFDEERALYHLEDAKVEGCLFGGQDLAGESPLKECRRLQVADSEFRLRYPFWHDAETTVSNCLLTETCRAPFWYCQDLTVEQMTCRGVKAFRECDRVHIVGGEYTSEEIFWLCRDVRLRDCAVRSVYPFFQCKGLFAEGLSMQGKYSFQYAENVILRRCNLDTKDAFWHAKNVVAEDCVIRGEYLGWYSENLRLVRCHIIGTQPLCYCKNLVLEDCTMEGCDLSFECSEVEAEVRGEILSVKNLREGSVLADAVGEVLFEENAPFPCRGQIRLRGRDIVYTAPLTMDEK